MLVKEIFEANSEWNNSTVIRVIENSNNECTNLVNGKSLLENYGCRKVYNFTHNTISLVTERRNKLTIRELYPLNNDWNYDTIFSVTEEHNLHYTCLMSAKYLINNCEHREVLSFTDNSLVLKANKERM